MNLDHTTSSGGESTIPWPGPRPFDENQIALFFGRRDTTAGILRKVINSPVSVLSARSGIGKTSVIRAGLIPALHARRNKSADERNLPELPICVRDWWVDGPRTPKEAFRNALSAAVGKLWDRGAAQPYVATDEDLARLAATRSHTTHDPVDFVSELCDAVGSVTLVLDQFEEILRWRGSNVDGGPLGIVVRMLHREAGRGRLRILLSLREEALPTLRDLEADIGGLASSTHHLYPLSSDEARSAILDPARQTGWEVDEAFADRLVEWLGQPAARPGGRSDPVARTLGDVWGEPFAGARLLGLQAVLNELAHEALGPNGGGRRRIDDELAHAYRQGLDIEALIGQAFVGSIERAFSNWGIAVPPILATKPDPVGGEDAPRPGPAMVALAKRIGALIAPELFNVAGFKVARRYDDLLGRAREIDTENSGLEATSADPREHERVSGIARRRGLRLSEVLEIIDDITKQTLRRLTEKNLLKSYAGAAEGALYELQHDGLGPWFNEWAKTQRTSIQFYTASALSLRGEGFSWGAVHKIRCSDLSWRGCEFEKKTFDEVIFSNCDFSGCYFTNCHFRKTRFHHCVMNGVVLRGCTIESSDESDGAGLGLHLQQVEARSILITGLKVEGSFRMDGAVLDGMTVQDCTVNSPWLIQGSRVVLANFANLRSDRTDRVPPLSLSDCDVAFSMIEVDVARGSGCVLIEDGPVPPSVVMQQPGAVSWRHMDNELLKWKCESGGKNTPTRPHDRMVATSQ